MRPCLLSRSRNAAKGFPSPGVLLSTHAFAGKALRHSTAACPCKRVQGCGLGPTAGKATSSDSGAGATSDGRAKATLENTFGGWADRDALEPEQEDDQLSSSGQPWTFGWQMNERNMEWSNDLKLRLTQRVAADELGIAEEDLVHRLEQLGRLLPGLSDRLTNAPAKLVARLAADPAGVANRMVLLKTLFPNADVFTMVSNRLSLVLDDDLDALAGVSARLQALLPGADVDRLVQDFPVMTDTLALEVAMQDAAHLMPGVDVVHMLRRDPSVFTSLMKGRHLIPYDQLPNAGS